jgi:hypothetical protein
MTEQMGERVTPPKGNSHACRDGVTTMCGKDVRENWSRRTALVL